MFPLDMQGDVLLTPSRAIFAYCILYNSSITASWLIKIHFPALFSSYDVTENVLRDACVFHFKVYLLQYL